MFPGDNKKTFNIGLDAGHGGCDPGAVYEGIKEKDITLQIVKDLYCLIKYYKMNIKPHLTRNKSTRLRLQERGERFNHLDLDLVLSIHCNAAQNALAKGALTFTYPGNQEMFLLGSRLLHNVPWELQGERKTPFEVSPKGWTKRANNVVSCFKASTVLFEMGFLSNNNDREYITSSRGRFAICSAIIKTITDYAHEKEQSSNP